MKETKMLHYIDPTDKSTWPPRNSYFYAKLKDNLYLPNPLDRYVFYYRYGCNYYDPDDEFHSFVEAGGEQYWEIAPDEIEYWLSFDELDECIKFFEENSQQKI